MPGPTAADLKYSAALAGKILGSGTVTATTSTALLTVAANAAVKLATAVLCNITSFAVTVTVTVTPGTGSGATVLSAYSLAANDTITAEDVLSGLKGALLDGNAVVAIVAGTANAVSYLLTGAVASA